MPSQPLRTEPGTGWFPFRQSRKFAVRPGSGLDGNELGMYPAAEKKDMISCHWATVAGHLQTRARAGQNRHNHSSGIRHFEFRRRSHNGNQKIWLTTFR